MQNKKIKKIILFFSIINVLLLCACGGLFFFIQTKNKETAEIYSSLYQKASEKGDQTALEKSLASTVSQRKILDSYFVQPPQTITFIQQIEKLGRDAKVNLKISAITPPKKPTESFFIDFTATGEFDNVRRLFAVIEEMPYLVSVKRAVFSQSSEKPTLPNSSPLWTGTFTITLDSYLP